jgi:apolipoprotein D and lipocalin family protein
MRTGPTIALGIALLAGSLARADKPALPTAEVDLPRYLGTWYEIARMPSRFEKGCAGVTATYQLREDGEIAVLNRCLKGGLAGEEKLARGHAWIPDKSQPGKLKVSFFWPFRADYWVVDLDRDYQWAVVGDPGRKYLWILSRTPTLDRALVDELTAKMKGLGFAVSRLEWTEQAPLPAGS